MKATIPIVIGILASGVAATPTTQDPRLARSVSIDAVGTDLGRLARMMSAASGVHFAVKTDIASEKLDVFVKDYPISALQRQVSALFSYRWAVTGKGEQCKYVLWRDANTRAKQERLRQRAATLADAHRMDLVDHVSGILAMKDSDVANLAGEDKGFAEWVRSDSARGVYGYLTGLDSDGKSRLLSNGRWETSLQDAASARLDSLERYFVDTASQGIASRRGQLASIELLSREEADPLLRWGDDTFWVRVACEDGYRSARTVPMTANALYGRAPVLAESVLRDNSADLRACGTWNSADERLKALITPPNDNVVDFHTGIQVVAHSTSVPILSDYYSQDQRPALLYKQCAYNATEFLAKQFGHQLVSHDDAVLLRSNDWPNLMVYEVPIDTLAAIDRLGKKGLLNLRQSLAASALTLPQLITLTRAGYQAPWMLYSDQLTALRMLAGLRKVQWSALQSGRSLPISDLDGQARKAYERLFEIRWTKHGYSPTVDSVRLGGDNQKLANGDTYTTATVNFAIRLPGVKKTSTIAVLVSPSLPASGGKGSASAKSIGTR